MNGKSKLVLNIVIFTAIIALGAGAGYGVYLWQSRDTDTETATVEEDAVETGDDAHEDHEDEHVADDATADWETYTSELYNYSFKYPKTWFVSGEKVQSWESDGSEEHHFRISGSNRAAIMTEGTAQAAFTGDLATDIVSILDQQNSGTPHPVKVLETGAMTAGDLEGIFSLEEGDQRVYSFNFVKDGYHHMFSIRATKDVTEEMVNEIKNILKSFKSQ